MYKIVIVDDEIFVRMGLKMAVDWESNGFALAGEASNGAQALEMIAANAPDIVITDIKMPGMDGIQLIKTITVQYPSVKCIVLSNYDEFELVKEAMKVGAVDYFLKVTIETDKLLEALKHVCAMLEGEKQSRNDITELRKSLYEHRAVIDKTVFLDLIKPELKPETVRDTIGALGLKLYDNRGYMMLLLVREYAQLLALRFHSDNRLLEFTLLNVVEELINHQSNGKMFELSPGVYAMIVSYKEHGDKRIIRSLADRIRTALKEYLSIDSNVVYGLEFHDCNELQDGLLKLDQAKLAAFYEEEGSVVSFLQPAFSSEGVHEAYMNVKKQIALYINLGDGQRVASCLDLFLEYLRENRIEPQLAKRYVAAVAGYLQDELIQRSREHVIRSTVILPGMWKTA